MRQKTLIIINPVSGSNRRKDFHVLFNNYLDREKFEFTIEYTRYRNHATELAEGALKNGTKTIVAVGGDGTINEVAKALLFKEVDLGVVPSGSGNGLARHLKIPMETIKAIKALNHARPLIIDTGSMNNHPFFCTAGAGFDAQVGHKFGGKRGLATYIRTSVSEFFSYKPLTYKIEDNNTTYNLKAFLLTFANTNQYGNNAFIAPEASLTDGKLNICILKPFPLLLAPDLGRRLFAGSVHKSRYMVTFTADAIKITRPVEGVVHLDGEPLIMGKMIDIKCIPKSLRILITG